ncbi:DUF6702 family protein [Emcibacter sp.]|uniref:DUF6702 family protein n=1 Tax=Emcibacter sp. TaxID=1979954 RepID=UPI002AA6020E|nr:DUF6702 family protein [Emcibacter sp.]
MRKTLAALLLFCLFGFGSTALAHRFAASFTVVEFREDKRAVQVTHRLFTHDVEDLIRARINTTDELSDEQIEAFLKEYIADRFALYTPQGEQIKLAWVGYEYAVEDIHIYREAALPTDLSRLGIINRILTETFPDQVNRVNIEKGGKVQTLVFQKGDGLKFAGFDGKKE